MLQSRIGYSTENLAREFEVCERTIYRDLCLLEEAGIPVRYDAKKRGYILQYQANIQLPNLSTDERIALLLAAHIFALSCIPEIGRPIHQAIGKLLGQTPASLREDIAGLLNSVGGKPSPRLWPQGSQLVVDEILTAIRQKRQIRIVYHPAEGSSSSLQTKITPHRLLAVRDHWFLIGRSSRHRKVCRFDLQHIHHAEQTEDALHPAKSPFPNTVSCHQPHGAAKPRRPQKTR